MQLQVLSDADLPQIEMFRTLFRGKWRLSILRAIASEPRRLSELRREVPHATKKMLVDTLYDLERIGWIQRIEHEGLERRVEYRLSEEASRQIVSVLHAISQVRPQAPNSC